MKTPQEIYEETCKEMKRIVKALFPEGLKQHGKKKQT